jgi:hypothetical protein
MTQGGTGKVCVGPSSAEPAGRIEPAARALWRNEPMSVDNFRADPLFPRIERAVAGILVRDNVVAPVDVLVGMGLLTAARLDHWRRGGVPYLEQVIDCNLARLSRLLRILRFHAHDLNLVPSVAVYVRRGKGRRDRLRFTKSGDAKLEEAYARHFVWPGTGPFRLSILKIPKEPGE